MMPGVALRGLLACAAVGLLSGTAEGFATMRPLHQLGMRSPAGSRGALDGSPGSRGWGVPGGTAQCSRRGGRDGAAGVAMQEQGGGGKFADDVDEQAEKIESGKVAVLSALSGSVAMAPLALLLPEQLSGTGAAFSPQWELQHDGLAVMLALFGLVYRYAVRRDNNPQLKQGVVGAFAISRAVALTQASDIDCTALPLQCGAPLGYLNWDMMGQLAGGGLESGVAFGASAFAIEACFARGWLKRFGTAGEKGE